MRWNLCYLTRLVSGNLAVNYWKIVFVTNSNCNWMSSLIVTFCKMTCPGREYVQDEEPKCQSMTVCNQFCFILQDQGIFMDDIIFKKPVGNKTSPQGQGRLIRLNHPTLNCNAWHGGSSYYLRGSRIRNSKSSLVTQPNVTAGNQTRSSACSLPLSHLSSPYLTLWLPSCPEELCVSLYFSSLKPDLSL